MAKTKKRAGDRKDGTLLRDLDSMHFIVPLLYPNRCDNEAYISECIDLTNLEAYLAKKNVGDPRYPLKLFYVLVAAVGKACLLRPKMNRFIANKNVYQRNELTAAFVVKKEFSDNGAEALAKLRFEGADTMDSLKGRIVEQITAGRSDKADASTESMDMFNKMPRFLSKFLVWIVTRLDIHGWVPSSLIETDPYYCTIVLTNLGSIDLSCGYHHLCNWGTCSCFVVIGKKHLAPECRPDGSVGSRPVLNIGITLDERIADGYYYSKTMKLVKHLLANPELLERPAGEEVDYLPKDDRRFQIDK